jgi:hypothetical protein
MLIGIFLEMQALWKTKKDTDFREVGCVDVR